MNEQSENQVLTPTPVPSQEVPEVRTESVISRYKTLIALLAGIVVSVGGYYGYAYLNEPAVAVVNGVKITEVELAENVLMMTKSVELQGMDVSDPTVQAEIRAQALTNLVNNELLLGGARSAGLGANEAAVQTAYNDLVTELGGEETLKERMATVGLTPETLMGNIGDRLMVDAYIEAETEIENITVSDEEIAAYVEAISQDGVTLPPLEDIRPQIEATLVTEKQQSIVDEFIEKLRSEAEIEIVE